MEAKTKKIELQERLEEINKNLQEISEKMETPAETESMETFLSEYRQKMDQLESLISNLTDSTSLPTQNTLDLSQNTVETGKSSRTWRAAIGLKLKSAKSIMSKWTSLTSSNKPETSTVTVTKYLPTSTINQSKSIPFTLIIIVVTKTIVRYEPTGSQDDSYQEEDFEKEELLTQARIIEDELKNPEIYGPDSIFLVMKDKCFESEDGR